MAENGPCVVEIGEECEAFFGVGRRANSFLPVLSHGKHAKQRLYHLAYDQPAQISVNAENRNCKEHKAKSYQQADHAVQESESGFAKSVQDAV